MRTITLAVLTCVLMLPEAAHVMAQDVPNDVRSEQLYRENAPKFHRNFSAGAFDDNGPLVTPDIDVDSNNVKLVGRQNFIDRIKRYDVAFPGLQLRDRVIIVDGNVAAVNYVLQGTNTGPYRDKAPSGNKIEAMSGEVFEFNPQGLMKKLITITELSRIDAQVAGKEKIVDFQAVPFMPSGTTDASYRREIKAAAARFATNFNEGALDRNASLATEDAQLSINGIRSKGIGALTDRLRLLRTAFPDMRITDEYVLADGNRAAVEYVMEGTQTGPNVLPGAASKDPTGKKIRVRGIDFLAFDQTGRVTELVTVQNQDDFASR